MKGKSSDWKVHHKSLVEGETEPLPAKGRTSVHTTTNTLLDLAHKTDFASKKLEEVMKGKMCEFPRNNGGSSRERKVWIQVAPLAPIVPASV